MHGWELDGDEREVDGRGAGERVGHGDVWQMDVAVDALDREPALAERREGSRPVARKTT